MIITETFTNSKNGVNKPVEKCFYECTKGVETLTSDILRMLNETVA